MKKYTVQYTLLFLLCTLFWGIFSLVDGQYYYFYWSTTSSPYQQWCSEQLDIRATTEINSFGALAWLLSLQLDPTHFSYYTWDLATDLQIYLFDADTSMFSSYTNPSILPQWIDIGKTILHIDRYRNGASFVGDWRYGTVYFSPKYSPSDYTGTFAIIYNGDTLSTSLSKAWGINIINSTYQYAHLTGYYHVYQKPCIDDITAPAATLLIPIAGTKKSSLSGISLTLLENYAGWGVPYVRTGGLPGIGTWTGNVWSITNQYGVNLNTFEITISWNWTGKYFTGGMFSPSEPLAAVPSNKSWQFRDKNYDINITASQLFYYGIEKTITITGTVADRNGNKTPTFTRIFNQPVGPWLIPWSANPSAGANWIIGTPPVILWIQDDRAGVDSWSIVIILSWMNWTNYGPYIFTGNNLHLSGVRWSANQPDYYITISGQAEFPTSWTLQVRVYAEDMEGNVDTISDYTFNTNPSCRDLGCCQTVSLQTGINMPFFYSWVTLNISWGSNPSFVINGNTGIVYCGTENERGMDIYKWIESNTWIYISYFDLPNFILSGSNVKAVLSWHTLYLQKIYVPPITTWWCIGSCGWGGWGGGSNITKDSCKLPSILACANTHGDDNSFTYYDDTCCESTWHAAASTCDVSDTPYSAEITDSFTWGYNLNITNKCPITEARLEDGIVRKELAKMMTMFTIQIFGIYPDTHKAWCDAFTDTKNLTSEMKFFTKTACQLDLMGLEPNGRTPKKVFDPNDPVPRTEFGTVLSRLIYGDQYNVYTWEELIFKFYEKHLKALNRDGIMKNIQNPFMAEKRAWVLLMLERTTAGQLVERYRLLAPAHNGAISLLENVW
ncbi:MAG: hypothetical protein ACD_80C00142G0020 [uncultured bacterium (gcode 4)]|uniref:SLH domain-containing protein n=1 Tax=uncultured bacterium (gcode 4) TaxID=1234023 RepID=K1XX56_9BACT|nr:MAG: hypothetical protein ACD_80C00142G0020 [uncultured bacterium (gcode 4)]